MVPRFTLLNASQLYDACLKPQYYVISVAFEGPTGNVVVQRYTRLSLSMTMVTIGSRFCSVQEIPSIQLALLMVPWVDGGRPEESCIFKDSDILVYICISLTIVSFPSNIKSERRKSSPLITSIPLPVLEPDPRIVQPDDISVPPAVLPG